MFPPANLDPQSTRWKNQVESSIQDLEKVQPMLDTELDSLQHENNSVLNQVSSRVNAYYTQTMAQYPVFQRSVSMYEVLGGDSATFSITAPASANNSVAENWVTAFSYNLALPAPSSVLGVRLNGAEFRLQGPSGFTMRFRWRVGTVTEGINSNAWMSRHQFNLSEYTMGVTEVVANLTNITNRYVHWTGAATSTVNVNLQACIHNTANPSASVASQTITMYSARSDEKPTYLDMMVTR